MIYWQRLICQRLCLDALAPYDEELSKLEEEIRMVQQRALEAADEDSMSASFADLEEMPPSAAKRQRGRPRKRKLPLTSEFVDVGSEDEGSQTKSEGKNVNLNDFWV